MIENIWGKKRILEVYLNVSEMGKGVFGIEQAARQYFNKSSEKLSRKESAMIAASLPNPKKYTVKPPSRYINQRYPWVLKQMNNLQGDPEIKALVD
jgi:monofunctional biosynthetic peptidoglycan transglycosylase